MYSYLRNKGQFLLFNYKVSFILGLEERVIVLIMATKPTQLLNCLLCAGYTAQDLHLLSHLILAIVLGDNVILILQLGLSTGGHTPSSGGRETEPCFAGLQNLSSNHDLIPSAKSTLRALTKVNKVTFQLQGFFFFFFFTHTSLNEYIVKFPNCIFRGSFKCFFQMIF